LGHESNLPAEHKLHAQRVDDGRVLQRGQVRDPFEHGDLTSVTLDEARQFYLNNVAATPQDVRSLESTPSPAGRQICSNRT
jgi:hypothetical protein